MRALCRIYDEPVVDCDMRPDFSPVIARPEDAEAGSAHSGRDIRNILDDYVSFRSCLTINCIVYRFFVREGTIDKIRSELGNILRRDR